MVKIAISDITSASKSEQSKIEVISDSAISTCTELGTTLRTTFEKEGQHIIDNVMSHTHRAEHASIAANDTWAHLNDKMKTSHSALAATNETAIKNTKILGTKLAQAENRINDLNESIALQSATIDTLTAALAKNDAHLKLLQNSNSSLYSDIVDATVKERINTMVADKVDKVNNDDNIFRTFLNTINNCGEEATKRIEQRMNDAVNSMQTKADKLTANIGVTVNKNCKTTSSVPSFDNPSETNQIPRSSLFPNVDPANIGMHNSNGFGNGTNDTNQSTQFSPPCKDHEYIYDNQRHTVNTNTFYKLRWSNQCTNEVDILSFYKALQHMASTCGIPMRDLDDIDENHGVCPLSSNNCVNFDKVYKLMKGALYYKLNDATLWTGYDQGWNLVKSNLLDCDGFEVLYDVLSEVLPKLNKNTPKSHKIQRPSYSDTENDNIYSYITAYSAFLQFEALGNHSRSYTPYEIAVYIADDLERDPHARFEKGITYVRLQLKYSPDGINVHKDISIAKIAKTICKYSPEYTVGEHAIQHTVHALKTARTHFSPTKPPYDKKSVTKDTSVKCSLCGQLGHDASSDGGCNVFAKWILCQQASQRLSADEIKDNTKKFLRMIKQRQSNNRHKYKIDNHIKCLECNEDTDNSALIHSLQFLRDDVFDLDVTDDTDSDE